MAGIEELKAALEKATAEAVAHIEKVSAAHTAEVVDMLLKYVTEVDIKLPNAAQ